MLILDWNLFIYGVFLLFLSHFKVFINIHEYTNEMIYISHHRKHGLCLSFTLVPSLVFYDK